MGVKTASGVTTLIGCHGDYCMSSIHIILVVVYLIMMEPSGVGISESNVVYQYDIPISPTLCGYILGAGHSQTRGGVWFLY